VASKIKREGLVSGTRPDLGDKILMTGADGFDGYEIVEYLGMTWGISVRAKDMGQDCLMGCKQLTGGELSSYSQMGYETRQRAIDDMMSMAKRQGANAIIKTDFDVEAMGQTAAAQVVAYGTAVVIRPIENYVPEGAIGNILADIHDQIAEK
jgi:uncharacterized protein YbjQ (UPF0145 family)